jgi:hypothetical protein
MTPTTRPSESTTGRISQSALRIRRAAWASHVSGVHVRTGLLMISDIFMAILHT